MNPFVRHAASVVMALSLIPAAAWVYNLIIYLMGNPGIRPFSSEALVILVVPWAVLWIIGYMMDGRMPWQILKKSE